MIHRAVVKLEIDPDIYFDVNFFLLSLITNKIENLLFKSIFWFLGLDS
jgi:hypothetical protein